MDILDVVSKAIVGITKNYGKKISKRGPAPEIPAVSPETISGSGYRIGFAREEIMPKDFESGKVYYIAGHGSGHKMENILSPVYVTAVWIDCGGDEGILWLGGDVVGLTNTEISQIREMILKSDVIKGVKVINFSSTHSHSGIDTVGYWGKPFASIPSDGKDPEYMKSLMLNCVKASEQAYLSRKSGKLYSGRIDVPGGLHSKRTFVDKHEVLTRLRFVPEDGSNETWILNFGGHPNSLGGSNRSLSGEYPYFMRENIKAENGADVLYGIGPVGGMDMAQLDENDNVNNIKLQAKMLSDAAQKIENDRELSPVIKYIQQPFYLPVGNYVLTLLAIKGTMSFKAYPSDKTDLKIAMKSEMTYMTFGDQKILLLPGENFVSTVYGGYNDKEHSTVDKDPSINPVPLCEICGDREMIAFGVSNDMTGYVVPPNDFLLNPTQPYLNGTKDRFGNNHYHETNSMGFLTQKAIADAFSDVVKNFG